MTAPSRPATTSTRGLRSRASLVVSVVAGLALIAPSIAASQPDDRLPPDEPAPPAPEVDPIDEEARELYVEAEAAYARGRYDEAIEKFQQSYNLSKRPLLLFNLANTYERMGAYGDAAAALRRYIASPDATDVEAIRQRIRILDSRATEARETTDELAALRNRPPCPDPVVCPALPVERASNRTAFIFAGVGAAGLLTSGIFGLVATTARSDAGERCVSDAAGTFCPDDAKDAVDRERTFSIVADVTLVASTLALGTGVILWWRNRNKAREQRTTVEPMATPESIGVGVAGWF